LQILTKNNLVDSMKGPNGGFEISRKKMEKTKLSQIVTAIDGDAIYKGCGLGLKECSEKYPCPVHDKFKEIRNSLKDMLEKTTVYELSFGLQKGLTFLRR
jgi:Rrf2 family iron-sulfur cluster assembly transcriptional regulator